MRIDLILDFGGILLLRLGFLLLFGTSSGDGNLLLRSLGLLIISGAICLTPRKRMKRNSQVNINWLI